MKKYSVVIVTKYYKTIEIEAKDEDLALDMAWDWAETNDTVSGAHVEVEIYDLEEVTA
jgi:hypothetical protein